jgi:cell division protein FtsB
MTQTIEQLTARIERLNYSLAQEIALSDRLKVASRMPGTGNYVEWIETIRNSHDQAEQLQAKVAELEEENERLKAELAKYRDAHVVAYLYKYRNCFGDEVWTTDHNWGNRIPFESKPLIVKPGEQ